MSEITRHFTVSTFIVHQERVLLHLHKHLGIWLPPGGHIDRDELPQEAAIREAHEETGLHIQLLGETGILPDGSTMLTLPWAMNLHNINEFHQHIDMEFLACCTDPEPRTSPNHGESTRLQWFSRKDLDSDELAYNVRHMSLTALHEVPKYLNTITDHPDPRTAGATEA